MMKRIPFAWLAGGLIAAIIVVLLFGAWLAFAVVDREMVARVTPVEWPTATVPTERPAEFLFPTFTAFPTSKPVLPLSATPAPTFIGTPSVVPLPAAHPTLGPDSPTCDVCHMQLIHGGG